MTITDLKTIDMIGYIEESKLCTLGISDHLDWEETHDHLHSLQEKIDLYINYIADGSAEKYFEHRPIEEYKVVVYVKFPPPLVAYTFLEKIQDQVTERVDFNFQISFDFDESNSK